MSELPQARAHERDTMPPIKPTDDIGRIVTKDVPCTEYRDPFGLPPDP